jgi:hypothetical protein
MKFRLLLAIAIGLMSIPAPTFAASTAIKRIDANEATALCPSLGKTGLLFGEPSSRQNPEFVEHLHRPWPRHAPFADAALEFTPWSDRLAAVVYRAAGGNADANRLWGEELEKSLRQAGWMDSDRSDLMSATAIAPKLFEMSFETPKGRRTIVLEFDVSAGLMLRCGDAELLKLSRNERDGELEPASPRPLAVAPSPTMPLPTLSGCSDPGVLKAFKTPGHVEEKVPALRRLMEGGFQIADQKRQVERLHTWLVWRLRTSGQVSEDRIWQVEEAAAPADSKDGAAGLLNLLNAAGGDFQSHNGPGAFCRSVIGLVVGTVEMDKHEIVRWAKINAALEVEARKLGVDVQ